MLTCFIRFKCNKALNGKERVSLRSARLQPLIRHRRCRALQLRGVDGLLNALDYDKRLEVSLHKTAKAQTAAHFKGNGGG